MIRLLLILLAIVVGTPALAQQEQLVARITCSAENHILKTDRSDREIAYPIISRRDEMPGTICDRRRLPPVCQTKVVYRFDISCNGVRVPWAALFGISASGTGNTRYEKDSGRVFINVAGSWEPYPAGFAPLPPEFWRIERMTSPPIAAASPPQRAADSAPQPRRQPVDAAAEQVLAFYINIVTLFVLALYLALGFFARLGYPNDEQRRGRATFAAGAGVVFCLFILWVANFFPLNVPVDRPQSLFPLGWVEWMFLGIAGYLVCFHGAAIVRGFHYAFVAHPAEPYVLPALQQGSAIDHRGLADTLDPGRKMQAPPPKWQSDNQAAKARAMAAKLAADEALMSAAVAHERARRAREDER